MGFTSDACWVLLIKTLLIKNNKKREAALQSEAGGDEKHVFFLLGLIFLYSKNILHHPMWKRFLLLLFIFLYSKNILHHPM